MSFPISIGDIVLMTKMSWTLARTFTKGRKSAPAEFREVESQLYSLSAALEAIKKALEKGEITVGDTSPDLDGQSTIQNILQNCLRTLEHLEGIVKKYGTILQPNASASRGLANWNQYVVRNWRKIEWTTEKGDLNALRSQIMVHTNSLNLLLGIALSSQAANIRESVERSSNMITELYEWYEDNLKGVKSTRGGQDASKSMTVSSLGDMTTDTHDTFQLAIRTTYGREEICPQTHFNRDWDQSFATDGTNLEAAQLFICTCRCGDSIGSHQATLQRYMLSHLTFPVRLAAAEREWILYKIADRTTNQLVTLYVNKIHPGYVQILEEVILQDIAIRQADVILSQGSGNSLTYISSDAEEARILVSIGELRIAQSSIESITFSHHGRTYCREYVENIQILQYQTMSLDPVTEKAQAGPLQPLDYAEVLVTYDEQAEESQSDVGSSILLLKRNTVLRIDESSAILRVDSIQTKGIFKDKSTISLDDASVTIHFTSREATRELHKKLEHMRMELYIRDLRYPRMNETISLHLQIARVECDSICITDADMTVVTDAEGKHRLIIESRNKCTLISQVLVKYFFKTPRGKPDYSGLTYVVQLEEDGTRNVYKYEKGFKYLNLSSPQADRMLKLAWSSMSMSLEHGSDLAEVVDTSRDGAS